MGLKEVVDGLIVLGIGNRFTAVLALFLLLL